jgi:hypothetical protein
LLLEETEKKIKLNIIKIFFIFYFSLKIISNERGEKREGRQGFGNHRLIEYDLSFFYG